MSLFTEAILKKEFCHFVVCINQMGNSYIRHVASQHIVVSVHAS